MMNNLTSQDVIRSLLPPSIGGVDTVQNAAKAIEPQLVEVAYQVPLLFLWLRLLKTAGMLVPEVGAPFQEFIDAEGLKVLDTATLEQLAKQLHVDFREAAENDTQLAGLIANSIAWHRIKGTPASIKAALQLCGFHGITIEEDGTGELWATYQLGLDSVRSIDDIKRIVAICNEMQPARCRLWRVYTTGEFDFRTAIWSDERFGWSYSYWSDVSGLKDTGIAGQDDSHDLVICLGIKNQYQAEPFIDDDTHAGVGREDITGGRTIYRDVARWSDCYWGDLFTINSAFVFGQLATFRLEHDLPKWFMGVVTLSRAMGIWSDDDDPWSDINCRWAAGSALIYDRTDWSDLVWSDGPITERIWIDEYFVENKPLITPQISHLVGTGIEGINGFTWAVETVNQHPVSMGEWTYSLQAWPGDVAAAYSEPYFSKDFWSEYVPTEVGKFVQRAAAAAIVGQLKAFRVEKPELNDLKTGGASEFATRTPATRRAGWVGEYGGGRRWLEYFGFVSISSSEV